MITDEIERDEKLGLFRNADVLVDTQVRDGLNLGPFEFLACHQDTGRVLLIIDLSSRHGEGGKVIDTILVKLSEIDEKLVV